MEMTSGLRAHGFKLTPQRLAVLSALREAGQHLTTAEVFDRARGKHTTLGLTTVYRTLEVLSDLGFVRRVHQGGRCRAYALVSEREGHHLVCQSCHRVVDFPCSGLTELISSTAERTGFTVESHLLELAGLCPACQ